MPSWSFICVTVVGVGTTCFIMLRWFSRRTITCTCVPQNLRHAVITGATSGIGRATAFELAKHNWRLTLGCRNVDNAKKIAKEIAVVTGNDHIEVKHLDLLEPHSISRFADAFLKDRVDVLINNAGLMAATPRPVDAFGSLNVDTTVNYLGPFYLTHLMIHNLTSVEEHSHYPRIVFVSSALSKRGSINGLLSPHSPQSPWNPSKAYADSKLAVCLFARELHRRFGTGHKKKLNVYCLFTGGMVHSRLNREIISKYPTPVQPVLQFVSRLLFKSPTMGCQSVVHCAISHSVPTAHSMDPAASSMNPSGSGLLYNNCVPIPWPSSMQDIQAEQLLWKQTMQFLDLKDD